MPYVCAHANCFRNAFKKILSGPAEPATLIGLALLVETVSLLAINIFSPPPFFQNPHTGLPELAGSMALLLQPLNTAAYLVILMASTCWLQIRYRASSAQCGRAAAKITFLASSPTLVAGLFILFGVLRMVVLGPGEAPTTFREHGFAFTYYVQQHSDPARWFLLASVVLRLPAAYFLGIAGGALGRGIARVTRRSSPQPV